MVYFYVEVLFFLNIIIKLLIKKKIPGKIYTIEIHKNPTIAEIIMIKLPNVLFVFINIEPIIPKIEAIKEILPKIIVVLVGISPVVESMIGPKSLINPMNIANDENKIPKMPPINPKINSNLFVIIISSFSSSVVIFDCTICNNSFIVIEMFRMGVYDVYRL